MFILFYGLKIKKAAAEAYVPNVKIILPRTYLTYLTNVISLCKSNTNTRNPRSDMTILNKINKKNLLN